MKKLFRKWAFTPSMVADAPDTAGVYALWRGEDLLHVGQAQGGEDTLRLRLSEHLEWAGRGAGPSPTHYSWEICNPRERYPQLGLRSFREGEATS